MSQPGYSAMMLQIFICALHDLLLTALPHPAIAELRAVLVGVSDYLTLDADLKGPANDVRLMAEVLVARGIPAQEITVLTSDPTDLPAGVTTAPPTKADDPDRPHQNGKPRPTRRYGGVLFLGPWRAGPRCQSGDEGGGYDEIFLPADAAGWKGDVGERGKRSDG